ncbi:unnamed protein product [Ilex paraguariensis]|uniref:Uncharacterized protein n=1 Tax=Ilex paraguariensis TaxID=185542 RepID=A0ABC8UA60_9AQUA
MSCLLQSLPRKFNTMHHLLTGTSLCIWKTYRNIISKSSLSVHASYKQNQELDVSYIGYLQEVPSKKRYFHQISLPFRSCCELACQLHAYIEAEQKAFHFSNQNTTMFSSASFQALKYHHPPMFERLEKKELGQLELEWGFMK